jgi:hypothetical protein
MDQAESLIADVPFYSVGILAFGVATFFIVMNRMQKYVMLHLHHADLTPIL